MAFLYCGRHETELWYNLSFNYDNNNIIYSKELCNKRKHLVNPDALKGLSMLEPTPNMFHT